MARINDLVSSVAFFVPEAPNPVIEQAIYEACHEFCKTSRAWREDVYETDLPAGEDLIVLDVNVPGHARVYDVNLLTLDGDCALEAANARRVQISTLKPNGTPVIYEYRGDQKIRVYPKPTHAHKITGEVVLVPREGTDILDDWLHDNFWFGIRHGAVYLLTSMSRKRWGDPNQAQQSANHFAREMENAKALESGRDRKKIRGTTYGGL